MEIFRSPMGSQIVVRNHNCIGEICYAPVVCTDGFEMSIQAGRRLRSTPSLSASSYTHVEIALEHGQDRLLDPYGGEGGIYSYVPARVVIALIVKHGGAVHGEIPPLDFGEVPDED